jgi:hypothetical protein
LLAWPLRVVRGRETAFAAEVVGWYRLVQSRFLGPPQARPEQTDEILETTALTERQSLDGGRVLPGFSLPLADLFARVKKPAKGSPKKGRGKGR